MRSQKQVILDMIRSSPQHMTADQIFLLTKKEHPSMAVGTVYRNLALLTEAGEIRRVEAPGQPAHYDKTLRPHEHKICLRCGQMEDADLRGDILGYLRQESREEVLGYHLSILYVCPACRTQEENG